ncbi:hypothetical protein ACQKFN_00775 [Serratia sp. NPDC071084]
MLTSMQVNYDVMDFVRSVTFMPTSELRWGSCDD